MAFVKNEKRKHVRLKMVKVSEMMYILKEIVNVQIKIKLTKTKKKKCQVFSDAEKKKCKLLIN